MMSDQFSFATATQIIFGKNSIERVPALVTSLGRKVLLISGKNKQRALDLASRFPGNTEVTVFQVESEPTTLDIAEGTRLAREIRCELVIAIGGGSVIDAAKAIAVMATNPGELMDYLEVIGRGKKLEHRSVPCIAIPTTAGTGAEVTKNSVIKSPEHQVKVSLRSDSMYPAVALVDPLLAISMPPELTASTGIDALTHLMETYVSNQANPFNDMLCREGMTRISRSLVKAWRNGNDENAREDMAMASLLGGMALANVKLGAVHGFAGPLGGMHPVPHGTVCASLMPAVIEMNIEAIKERNGDLSKYEKLAKILTANSQAKPEDNIGWAKDLVSELRIPPLSSFGLTETDFPELVQKSKVSSSMKGNPVELNEEQLTRILKSSL
jgi:alcohol dehydrogenase class IV